MPYAVILYVDDETTNKIENVWKKLDELGIASYMVRGKIRPHITLGVYENLDIKTAEGKLKSFAESQQQFDCLLSFVGLFTGEHKAAFLGVAVSEKLRKAHHEFHQLMDPVGDGPNEYFLPNVWIPHVTMAFDLTEDKVEDAIRVCRQIKLPLTGQVEKVSLVDVSDGDDLAMYNLGSGA